MWRIDACWMNVETLTESTKSILTWENSYTQGPYSWEFSSSAAASMPRHPQTIESTHSHFKTLNLVSETFIRCLGHRALQYCISHVPKLSCCSRNKITDCTLYELRQCLMAKVTIYAMRSSGKDFVAVIAAVGNWCWRGQRLRSWVGYSARYGQRNTSNTWFDYNERVH